MDRSQFFIVLGVTGLVSALFVLMIYYVPSNDTFIQNGELVKYLSYVVGIGIWIFLVCIIDIYMEIKKLKNDLKQNYNKINNVIMQKYVTEKDKCT